MNKHITQFRLVRLTIPAEESSTGKHKMCSIQGLTILEVFCRLPLASGRDRIHPYSGINVRLIASLFIYSLSVFRIINIPTIVHYFDVWMESVQFYTRHPGIYHTVFPFQEESKRTGLLTEWRMFMYYNNDLKVIHFLTLGTHLILTCMTCTLWNIIKNYMCSRHSFLHKKILI